MSKKTHSKLRQFSNKTNTNYSATTKAQHRHEDLSERPYTIEFNNVINKGWLVRGLRNAGFDIDGAQSFGSFHESKMDIVFVTRRHGKRVLQAFQGGLTMPGVSKKVIATNKYRAGFDKSLDVLSRDANRPAPEVEQIRNSVLEAYGFPRASQDTTQPATVINEDERDIADAVTGTVAHKHPSTGRQDVAYWVEDGVRFVLSRELIGKRKRDSQDEKDEERADGRGNQGHKRPCR